MLLFRNKAHPKRSQVYCHIFSSVPLSLKLSKNLHRSFFSKTFETPLKLWVNEHIFARAHGWLEGLWFGSCLWDHAYYCPTAQSKWWYYRENRICVPKRRTPLKEMVESWVIMWSNHTLIDGKWYSYSLRNSIDSEMGGWPSGFQMPSCSSRNRHVSHLQVTSSPGGAFSNWPGPKGRGSAFVGVVCSVSGIIKSKPSTLQGWSCEKSG